MPLLTFSMLWVQLLLALLLACELFVPAQGACYRDVNTGIRLYAYTEPDSHLFGIRMPQLPSTDFVAQLSAPHDSNNG